MAVEAWIREGESQESLLRRFQRMVQMEGILREAKNHRHFVSKRDTARIKVKIMPGEDGARVMAERGRQ